MTIRVVEDLQEMGCTGAELFSNFALAAIQKRSRFTVVLSGGKTPRSLYRALASKRFKSLVPWDRVHVFWGDERDVESTSSESNFQMAWTTLLSPLSLPSENIHRVRTELHDPKLIAQDYEDGIRAFFGIAEPAGKPRFDMVLLGLGQDGHTASLFPDGEPSTEAIRKDPNRLVIAPWVPHLNGYRISLTPAALNQADHVLFLVSGQGKAEIAEKVIAGGPRSVRCPAETISPVGGELIWLLDRPAAMSLPDEPGVSLAARSSLW